MTPKIFFSLQSLRRAESFEGLNSSSVIGKVVMQLLRHVKTD